MCWAFAEDSEMSASHKGVLTVTLLFAFAVVARATTFSDYRTRLSQAASVIQQLETPDYYTDDSRQAEDLVESALARLRHLVPETENVTFDNQTIEVDNKWFHKALAEYEKKRRSREHDPELIHRTREQLRALIQRLDEMKGGAASNDKPENALIVNPTYIQGNSLRRLLTGMVGT